MIQIDVVFHTDHNGQDGLSIPSGAVIDVIPSHPSERLYDDEGVCIGVRHDVHFDQVIYKSLDDFEAGGTPLVNSKIREFDVSYTERGVDPSTLTSQNIQDMLRDHIENGGNGFPGLGANSTQIVYPSWA
jgi:hypothetical protein